MDPVADRSRYRFRASVRVRFADTDAQGVVHHATFLAYAEAARHEYWAALGISRFAMAREGVDDTSAEVQVRYRRAARFHDLLDVHARTALLGRTSCIMEFLVTRGGSQEAIAEMRSAHVILDPGTGRPTPLPNVFRKAVLEYEGEHVAVRASGRLAAR